MVLEPLYSIVEDIHLWARSSATGLSRTRVGSEILCGCEVGAPMRVELWFLAIAGSYGSDDVYGESWDVARALLSMTGVEAGHLSVKPSDRQVSRIRRFPAANIRDF